MLGSLLRMGATAQLGAQIRKAVKHRVRQAVLLALAGVVLLGAAIFGLIAGYSGLRTVFTSAEAAGLIAVFLTLAGLALLALRSFLSARDPKRPPVSDAMPEIDAESLKQIPPKVAQSLGSANTLALALIIGIAAGRGLSRSRNTK
jgi:MFS family permease